jgi:uncharacterized membrane protein
MGDLFPPIFLRRRLQRSPWLPTAFYLVLAVAMGLAAGELAGRVYGLSKMASASVTAILTSVASGMMALTGIVFAIILLSIDFSGTSYGPRLIHEMSRRPLIGHAMGIFTATFTYSILALRAVDRAQTTGVPTVVVWVTFAWLAASVILLVAVVARPQNLILSNVLDQLTGAGTAAVTRRYPALRNGAGGDPVERVDPLQAVPGDAVVTQEVRYHGLVSYLRALEVEPLVEAARRADGVIVVLRTVGDPLSTAAPVALVMGARTPVSPRLVRKGLQVGRARAMATDPAYALRLLVDVGVRALSAAINDPTTAVNVLDEIEHLLLAIGRSRFDEAVFRDANGVVRVVYRGAPSWDDLLDLALLEMQQYGRDSYQVQRRLGALLHLVHAGLPAARRPEIARLIRRREATIAGAFPPDGRQVSIEAADDDPQGLGHTLDGAPWS